MKRIINVFSCCDGQIGTDGLSYSEYRVWEHPKPNNRVDEKEDRFWIHLGIGGNNKKKVEEIAIIDSEAPFIQPE